MAIMERRNLSLLFVVLFLSSQVKTETCGLNDVNANLGYGYDQATASEGVYSAGCFPPLASWPGNYPAHGYDDSVAVFVGGDFTCIQGAEVEGIAVVLGDLVVQSGGPSNFVAVGYGTQVLPNNGVDCVIVGGDIEAYRSIEAFRLWGSEMGCNVVYKGNAVNPNNWKVSPSGAVIHNPSYDMSQYEMMKEVFLKKSAYWATLPATSTVANVYSTVTFTCTADDDLQVFHINDGDNTIDSSVSGYVFSSECEGKTILINIYGTGSIYVKASSMRDWKNQQGGDFATCFKQSILWNFPEANDVTIGPEGFSEFEGTLLVAGDLLFRAPGHSGRTIVLGDLTQQWSGSEFHSYQFRPSYDLPCVCIESSCYEEGRCNPSCVDNECATEECVPIEVDCAELLTTNVTLPSTVVYTSCNVNVTLILREDENTVLIEQAPYGCELNVETCEDGIYLGCTGPGFDEAGMYFTQTTEGSLMDLTGSYMVNSCCTPVDPATNRTIAQPRACDYYTPDYVV